MSVSMQIDTREFSATLRQYLARTSKTLPEAINGKAGRVAWRAIVETRKAERGDIEALGVSGYRQIKSRKTGEIRRGRPIYNENGRMRDIIAARYYNAGQRIPDDLDEQVRKGLAARLRSIGFIKSGWIPAYRKLRRYIGQALTWTDARQRGKAKGRATVAQNGFNPIATIANTALPSAQAMRLGVEGLNKAFRAETADMRVYLERKMKEDARASEIEVK